QWIFTVPSGSVLTVRTPCSRFVISQVMRSPFFRRTTSTFCAHTSGGISSIAASTNHTNRARPDISGSLQSDGEHATPNRRPEKRESPLFGPDNRLSTLLSSRNRWHITCSTHRRIEHFTYPFR